MTESRARDRNPRRLVKTVNVVSVWGRLDNTYLILSRSSQQTPFVIIGTPLTSSPPGIFDFKT